MLLNAVIIILREVIEASLIISVFLAFSQTFHKSSRWLYIALAIGLSFATLYAININTVSEWFEGVGLDIFNAGTHIMIYLILVIFSIVAMRGKRSDDYRLISWIMIAGVSFATLREGSEIILYISGFSSIPELLQPILLGSAIGAGIGLSVGVLFYYLLVNLRVENGVKLGLILIFLIAGSMIIQAVQLLIQADWVVSQYPLWDSSMLISEHSIIGQLLYALVGYEATPTPTQVIAYFSALIIIVALAAYSRIHCSKV